MAAQEKIGVLLCNLGTPDAPTRPALRRYLKEFLSDRRVVDFPRPLWWLILHGVILNIRPNKSAALYRKIWTENGSPLLDISLRQKDALQAALEKSDAGLFHVEIAMRYGNPSIAVGLAALQQAGCRKALVLPLYPQYSRTTTESTFDALADAIKASPDAPELRRVRDYHDDAGYIAALAGHIEREMRQNGCPDKLIMSFHGIPKRYYENGDPYPDQCRETARLVAERLNLSDDDWLLTFQSRFGREEWMQPYTDKTLERLAGEGVKSVAVVCPGFAVDCLETLEEIAMQNREIFLAAGGEDYRYIPALNDNADHIRALAEIVRRHCHDWLKTGA